MKTVISFKIDAHIKKAIQKLAEQENRSFSNYVTTLLIKQLEAHGIDWRKEGQKKVKS